MWNKTRITELLGIKYPILQGPLGGGFSTTNLLIAVSNAGGLGSYGAYTLSPEQLQEVGEELKAKTNKPYNINLWVSDIDSKLKDYPVERIEKIKQLFKPYFDEVGVSLPSLLTNIPSKFEKQVEVLFKIRPAVFSFSFGIPSQSILDECRRLNIKLVGAATTLDEAQLLQEAKVDAIIAAGFEGGGHRPSFLKPAEDSLTGTFALLQQFKGKIKIPIIAAGGITNGRGIAAALTLGADAIQLGTAFLACEESNATDAHRQLLFSDAAKYTVLSKALTGRLGRMLPNRIADGMKQVTEVLPFPLQTQFLAPLKAEALKQGKTELAHLWAGQGAPALKYRKVDELIQALIEETNICFK